LTDPRTTPRHQRDLVFEFHSMPPESSHFSSELASKAHFYSLLFFSANRKANGVKWARNF